MTPDEGKVRGIEHGNMPPQHMDKDQVQAGLEVGVPPSDGPIVVPDTPAAYVDHGGWSEAMEVARGDNQPQHSDSDNSSPLELGDSNVTEPKPTGRKEREASTVCGVRKKTFIAIIIGLVLIGAIVGGAVGGTQASKRSSQR